MKQKRLPPFATGSIVNDYSPLYAYWSYAESVGRQDAARRAMIDEDDFEFLRKLISNTRPLTLLELMDALKLRSRERIDGELASRSLGMPQEAAVEVLSSILAGWLIEAGETFKLLGLRQRFRLPES